ncbi:bifunctional DNA-formamidopyrimidine glycosylase/DNA-(apurinic or apyrimidinic site) lyase [Cellulomonas soli]|uniref:bifunctional DNA-formamidopyrimidine glycosylase/DNA-(apurinic or apyrimidinic site) lyase n=1 Tax=Cellulomonas soli TaxID=931535 RepID=UPI003F84FD94
MPELPEVETVRDGLERHVLGRTVLDVEVLREYSVRRHEAGPLDLVGRLRGRVLSAAVRRGKFLWVLLDEASAGDALLVHLGMSGQLLVREPGAQDAAHPHLRVRIALDDGSWLDFVDQRTFGHLSVQDLVATRDGGPGGAGSPVQELPVPVAHIARDLLDPSLDRGRLVEAVRARRTGIKRALLDQGLVSGIGNIYADEGLWRAQLHHERAAGSLTRAEVGRALDGAHAVMSEALRQGGTSFDALYVNVNGQSGYFDRSLAVYGQEGRPCPRCGTPVRREAFMNRSAFTCPACQRPPRAARRAVP